METRRECSTSRLSDGQRFEPFEFHFPNPDNGSYAIFNTAGTTGEAVLNDTVGEMSNTADYSREIQFSLRFEF